MHAFVVLGLVFPYQAKRLAYFVSSGMQNLNSINQST